MARMIMEADAFAKREWVRYQDLKSSDNLSIEKDQICDTIKE